MKKILIIIISLLIYSCSNTNLYRVTITQGTVFAQEDIDKLETEIRSTFELNPAMIMG